MITIRMGKCLPLILLLMIYICVCLALAVYVRSPAAYKALQNFGILKLPCKSTMQAYTGAFMHELGQVVFALWTK